MSEELKAQLIGAYRSAFDAWLDAVADLGPDAWSTPTGCPGWDVHDQLAHVVSVEREMLGDPPDRVQLPADLDHVTNPYGEHVEVGVQARRGMPPAALVSEARATFERRLADLAQLDPTALGEPMDGPAGTSMKASRMLRTRIFDITTHEHDVRRAVDRPSDGVGHHVTIATELVLRSWAALLPDRLGREGVLAIDLADRGRATIDLADGTLHRGSAGPDATARIAVTPSQLLAIGGGRSDAPTIDHLDVEGDVDLVARLLEHGSVTP